MENYQPDILFPKQISSCREATARLNIWSGAVRSGKTFCSIWKWLSWVRFDAPKTGNFLIAARTERTAARNIIDIIQNMIGEPNFVYNRGTGRAYYAGRIIHIIGGSDERSEGKVRGLTLSGVYFDEITLLPQSFFKMILSRLSVPGARAFGTTNPDSPAHWFKVEFLDRAGELDLRHFRFQLADNTRLTPEFKNAISREYVGLWYKRFILGEWVSADGQIYDMFDMDRHVRPTEEIEKLSSREAPAAEIVAVDYGTSNPTAALYGRRYNDGHVHIVSEYYYDGRLSQRQKTDEEYIADFRTFYSNNGIARQVPLVIDPSAASLKAAAARAGFIVRDAHNAVLDGIRTVASRLSAGTLTIDPSCKNLVREMSVYEWDKRAQSRGEDAPLKENDHAQDACRYLIMELRKSRGGQSGMRTY